MIAAAERGLRILMISAYYPPALNGYAIQCGDTADLLAARGHDVRVLTSAAAPVPPAPGAGRLGRLRTAPPEEHMSVRPAYLTRQLRRRGVYRGNYRECGAVAKTFQPEIAVLWQFAPIGIAVVHALQRLGIPVLFNVEDYSLSTVISLLKSERGSLLGAVRRWLYGVKVDELDLSHLAIVSGELRAHYHDAGFPLADMTVIHNGIQSERIARAAPAPGPGTRLLFVGRLHPTKGLILAIDALAQVNQKRLTKVTLDLIGTGETQYVDSVKALARELGVADCIRFLGHRERADIFELYRDYDVLLFPSIWAEPFGLTVIEAMGQGVPVIALDRGGPKEIITNMIDGLLVSSETAAAVAQAIALLVDTPQLRQDMAAAAIRTIAERFTLEHHVDRTERLMRTIVDSRRERAAEVSAVPA
jgi:glycosyltransferase involved in cell wall biosynthesis